MKFKSLAVLSMGALVLAACGNDAAKEDTKSSDSSNSNSNTTKQVIALNDIKTSPKEAVKKAQDTYKGQELKEIAFEKTNGDWTYKIAQQKTGEESEVIIADKDKKIVNKSTEKEDSVDKSDNFKYSDAIDYKEAIKKGQKEFDGDIKEWSLDKDDGKLVYNMDLKKDNTKHEITIDAKSGKVLKNEEDN
ncbi:PepSY domain-containing protein [Staphylococcus simiae]|uniref:PepSY domain-containing protein n=1 Tax=Staphylococcus simiae TaxID=308354 RepID=UPI001A9569AD|nr:PepSY domain-containing protein [Staphylococcus simiae]MBO1199770.1 PepSY domain-containing protein [Staphylococcus simiae]MBO1202046.1 PepSY domain-containing protein [Staphylococcus simiae]MBO1204306.1 PepSY domain-containing protein [Staphylococcus simiae]MBO1212097.1 PepSY domain-containing protein [Staphylococcus simiae]MBO1230486.1 PepSY domain-containing protein [Staphylococcus simiae]